MTTPLITSVAPSMSRNDGHGREIGSAYQEACIRSWIAAGFRVISVNGPDDTVPFGELMEVVRTPRTAKELHGKPVVFIADLFEVAARVTPAPVCIVNADILLRPGFDIASAVANLRPDQALIARRLDIATLGDTSGERYEGFDLFAAHASALAKIPDRTFAVGLHWWDHIVPLELKAQGINVNQIAAPLCVHLLHGKNWNQREWFNLGIAYAQRVQELPAGLAVSEAYQERVKAVVAHHDSARRYAPLVSAAASIDEALGARAGRSIERHTARALRNLARESFSIIDSACVARL